MYELPEGNTCEDCTHFTRCLSQPGLDITKMTTSCQLALRASSIPSSLFLLDDGRKPNKNKSKPKQEKPRLNIFQAAKRLEILEKRAAKDEKEAKALKDELKQARKEASEAMAAHAGLRIKLERQRGASGSGGNSMRPRRSTAQRQAALDAHNARKQT